VLVNTLASLPSSNFIPSVMASGTCQSSFDLYDLFSDDEEYITPNNMAEITTGQSNGAAPIMTATRLRLKFPPEAVNNWGQINRNLNDYHTYPMDICSTFWIPDRTDWWRQQYKTHTKYANLSNQVREIFSIIPHGVGVVTSFSFRRDVIGWRQSKSSCETLRKKAIVRQFAHANNGILSAAYAE